MSREIDRHPNEVNAIGGIHLSTRCQREPGFYWVKEKAAPQRGWTIAELDADGGIYTIGWDAGSSAEWLEWGPRIAPPAPPVHVAVFDDGRFEFVRRFSVLAEAQAFKDGIEACPSLHSTGESVYLLPDQEAAMRLDQHGDEVAKAAKAIAAVDEVAT